MTNLLAAAATKTRKVKTNPKLVVGYVRVSTDEQRLSPAAQVAELESYAAKHGLTLASVHQDVGVSGAAELSECPGLTAAISEVQTLRAGGLLVLRLDRLARDTKKAAGVEWLLDKAGARVLTVDGTNSEDPFAQMARMFQSWMAQQERYLISQRTKSALKQLSAQGKRVSRVAPYGFTFDGGAVVPVESEQRGLQLMLDLSARGYGPRIIAKQLTDEGFRSRTGKDFDGATVYRVLQRQSKKADA
jgi:DNA invertase Pin-like site-specific DNA recombinase